MKASYLDDFRSTLRDFIREVDKANNLNSCEVTESQCHALLEISSSKNLTVNQLADKLNLDKSTVSRTVDNLQKNKLIKRTTNKLNRREVVLNVTNQGITLVSKINSTNNQYFEEVFESIKTEELSQFLATLKQVTQNMNLLNQKNEQSN